MLSHSFDLSHVRPRELLILDNQKEGLKYHPGRNYYKTIPWNIFFCDNLCNYYKNPPEYFLCNLTATGLLLFVRGHAKDFVL